MIYLTSINSCIHRVHIKILQKLLYMKSVKSALACKCCTFNMVLNYAKRTLADIFSVLLVQHRCLCCLAQKMSSHRLTMFLFPYRTHPDKEKRALQLQHFNATSTARFFWSFPVIRMQRPDCDIDCVGYNCLILRHSGITVSTVASQQEVEFESVLGPLWVELARSSCVLLGFLPQPKGKARKGKIQDPRLSSGQYLPHL